MQCCRIIKKYLHLDSGLVRKRIHFQIKLKTFIINLIKELFFALSVQTQLNCKQMTTLRRDFQEGRAAGNKIPARQMGRPPGRSPAQFFAAGKILCMQAAAACCSCFPYLCSPSACPQTSPLSQPDRRPHLPMQLPTRSHLLLEF